LAPNKSTKATAVLDPTEVTSIRQIIACSLVIHLFWAEDLDRRAPAPKAEFEFEVQQFNIFSYDDLVFKSIVRHQISYLQ